MNPLSRFAARVRVADPWRVDVALAAFGCVTLVAETTFIPAHGGSRPLTALVGVLAIAPAAWRRRAPLAVGAIFGAVVVLQTFLDTFLVLTGTTPFIVALVLLYTAGRYEEGRRAWVAAALIGGAVYATLLLEPSGGEENSYVWGLILLIPPVLAGRAMRDRVRLQRELREKTERLEAEREQRALEAADSERDRIAAELQAVVAESVSAIVVQAEAVPRVLESGDASLAAEALELIEETGREALGEMRRLLGVLRRDGDRPDLAPQPTLARTDALVEEARNGIPIELTVAGQAVPLAPGVDLAAYRVLQEALAAATRAGGVSRVDVEVRYGERDVSVAVVDDRASGGPDAGALAAMRERVRLYDGSLRAEPRRDARGYRVTARLPRQEVPA